MIFSSHKSGLIWFISISLVVGALWIYKHYRVKVQVTHLVWDRGKPYIFIGYFSSGDSFKEGNCLWWTWNYSSFEKIWSFDSWFILLDDSVLNSKTYVISKIDWFNWFVDEISHFWVDSECVMWRHMSLLFSILPPQHILN